MPKALIFIKSPKKDTYEAILEEIESLNSSIDEITWIFYQRDKDENLIPRTPFSNALRKTENFKIEYTNDLKIHITDVKLVDISGLPKEDVFHIVPFLFRQKDVDVFTLTKEKDNTSYINLFDKAHTKKFRDEYIHNRQFHAFTWGLFFSFSGASFLFLIALIFPDISTFKSWLLAILGTIPSIVLIFQNRERLSDFLSRIK